MEIILLERVEKLGQMGDTVSVKPGYARNYLLPQGKALRATAENIKRFENDRAQLEAENLKRRSEAEDIAGRMGKLSVVIIRAASEAGQLYGSVNARDISDAISEAGFTVSRGQVIIERPIKMLGIFPIRIRLHPEVAVEVNVNVAQSQDEADAQADRVARGEPAVLTAAILDQMEAAQIAAEHAEAMAEAAAEAEADEHELPVREEAADHEDKNA